MQADQFHPGRVVPFGQERRLPAPQTQVRVVVRMGGDPPVLPRHGRHVGVPHQPERGLRVGDPAVQQHRVGVRVQRAQRELAEPLVEAGERAHAGLAGHALTALAPLGAFVHAEPAGHALTALAPLGAFVHAGTPKSWNAIRRSIG
ncbi:hypothetical protein GCM10027605_37640 [Micromonospora zhanjiangensis]